MRTIRLALLLGALSILASAAKADDAESPERRLYGWVEWIVVEPAGLRIKSRLDTGAKTSSLHAVDIEPFERDDEEWVRFRLPVEDHKDIDEDDVELRTLVFERPVTRTVAIKSKSGPSQDRYVVDLEFCLDGNRYETQFSLTDRGNFSYPALLGRRVTGDMAFVDPGHTFLASLDCDYREVDEFEAEQLLVGPEELEPMDAEEEEESADDDDDDDDDD